jgi:hypothetical protein
VSARLIMDGKDLVVHNQQDVEDVIESNKLWQNEKQTGSFRKIAEIPVVFLQQWLNEELARGNTTLQLFTPEFDAVIKRKLADRDWMWLRST